jgi:hypothetical protein
MNFKINNQAVVQTILIPTRSNFIEQTPIYLVFKKVHFMLA